MADSKVETLSRLAQWRVDNRRTAATFQMSRPFKMGIWNWHLLVRIPGDDRENMFVRLFPQSSEICKEQPPFARFVFRVSVLAPAQKVLTSQVYERRLQTYENFGWCVDCAFHGCYIIDVEFLDLKICPLNGGDATPIWLGDGSGTIQMTHRYFSRMFEENIHSDVTINTSEGSVKTHKAILCACSPVFQNMFYHDLKEKASSTIYIEDMSLESCTALLKYLYGTMKKGEFWKHRFALLEVANKYEITDLKDACEESFLQDISSNNVLERLQQAWLYRLDKLKKACLMFLFNFGRIHDVREELNDFFRQVDRELMLELFQEMLSYLETYTKIDARD